LRVNPGDAETVTEWSILFAVCARELDLKPHAVDANADVFTWLPTFTANRAKAGGFREVAAQLAARHRAKAAGAAAFAGTPGAAPPPRRRASSLSKPAELRRGSFGGDERRGSESGGSGGSGGLFSKGVGLRGLILAGMEETRSKAAAGKSIGRMPLPVSAGSATSNAPLRLATSSSFAGDDPADAPPTHALEPPQEVLGAGGHAVLLMLYDGDDQASLLFSQAEVIIGNLRATSDTAVVIVGPAHGEAIDLVG
jgi:hypothetical protein